MSSAHGGRDAVFSSSCCRAALACLLYGAALVACGSDEAVQPEPGRDASASTADSATAVPMAGDAGDADNPDDAARNAREANAGLDSSSPAHEPDDTGSPTPPPDASLDTRADAARDAGPVDAGPASFDRAAIKALMSKAANWQLTDYHDSASNDWIDATFYAGLMAAYRTTAEAEMLSAAKGWAGRSAWATHSATSGPRFADNQTCTQTYLEIYELGPTPANAFMVDKTRAVFDTMVAAPKDGRVEWNWCDALFMAPPALTRAGMILQQPKYVELMHAMFVDVKAYLFSTKYNLFYRDAKYLGTDTFWARGNGWVVAGTARILDYLPADDGRRAFYNDLLVSMAGALAKAQQSDGLWRTSLLHPEATGLTGPETSGTGFFTYAMAWGINHGVLPRDVYLPVVTRGWNGLVRNVNADGRLGYVQRVGEAPYAAAADETHPFGVGAFLFAGSEVVKL